ncbi:paramyosin-like [Palaemon carinicauda]|uniref:paramyosin-like n=1 Tax=Palaemon carinicauda TaxID=392227 RepID=UPI0035B5E60C
MTEYQMGNINLKTTEANKIKMTAVTKEGQVASKIKIHITGKRTNARIHQETETANDLQRICEEVHDEEAEEIELSTDNVAISALNADLDRASKKIQGLMARLEIVESQNDELREELSARTFVQVREIDVCNNIGNLALIDDLQRVNKNIGSLFVSLEKAEARNDHIRDELLAKAYVEKELENAREEIRILEKKLERVTEDLKIANEKLLEKRDLEEYVESADNEIRTLWAELDSVKAENKRLKTENVCEKAGLERNGAVYDGANYVAGQTKENAQLEEASKKDLSEELGGAEEGIQLFDDFFARIHQETETANDLQRICEEVHDEEAEEIELSTDNIAISALNADLDRANKKIQGLMARLEKAESQNDELREELSARTFVQVKEIDVCNNIGNLALIDDLQRANKNIGSLFLYKKNTTYSTNC